VVVDVDGNSLIDFGSGIAVTTIGNSAPRVVAAVRDQVQLVHPHLLHDYPVRGYVAVCEQLARLTPGDHEKRSALFNLRS
jgi:4-aminobutyrate aminotransferase/(S)-3-amino-2-methylpropionate transaminase